MARRPLTHRIALRSPITAGALTLTALGATASALSIFSLILYRSAAR